LKKSQITQKEFVICLTGGVAGAKIFMPKPQKNYTLYEAFTQPLKLALEQCKHRRDCSFSDLSWLEACVSRVLSHEPSGRGFLQYFAEVCNTIIKRSNFFESLKSPRRLALCQEVNEALLKELGRKKYCEDPFARYKELNGFAIYAGDGHYHEAASHDSIKDGTKYATPHFFSLNLRTHGMRRLTVADTSGMRKKEHDMHMLKRLSSNLLRCGEKRGTKVVHVWDRAGIDFAFWSKQKMQHGVYVVSRAKSSMKILSTDPNEYSKESMVNAGVLADDSVITGCGISMRLVTYQCPTKGTIFKFVTTITSVEPGLIAYMYKCRWDIEKVFDETKRKLLEAKAWGSTDNAKTVQANFICMVHNLMMMLEEKIDREQGVTNEADTRRRERRLEQSKAICREHGRGFSSCLEFAARASQRSVRFIRWLRNNLHRHEPWMDAVEAVARIYASG
jgi:hypothetical protein